MKSYPAEFSLQLADELDTFNPNSNVHTAIADYQDLRELIRACERATE